MEVWRLWIIFGGSLLSIDGHLGLAITGVDVVKVTNCSFTFVVSQHIQWTVCNSSGQQFCFCNYSLTYKYNSSCLPAAFCSVWNNSLTIMENPRDADIIFVYNGTLLKEIWILRIIAIPVVTTGSCSLRIVNWTVTGSCNVTGMYSPANYTCRWREKNNINEEFGGFQMVTEIYNTTTSTSGVCSFTRPIPFLNGSYTYIMRVSPGSDAYYNNTIVIDPPDQVQLNHSCPSYVLEGSSVSCTCNATRMGSPPGLVAWSGMTNATLLLTNVSQNTSGKQFTCRLEWGPTEAIKEMISYILTVAYGPSDVIINRIAETTDDKSGIIRFTCSAINFYPSVEFVWNTTCENRTDYTHFSVCSINITQSVDHVGIECTATNTYFAQTFFSRVFVLSIEESEQESKATSAICLNTAVVAGVGATVIALIIIAALLIACIIILQRGMSEKKRRPLSHLHVLFKRPKSQILTDSQSASLENIYSIASPITADHGVDNTAVYETAQSSVTYDNRIVTQEIGGRTTELKPLTKPMSTRAAKDLSDTVYETGSMRTDIKHDYEEFSPKGFKASRSSDTSNAKVVNCNEDENHYENVTK